MRAICRYKESGYTVNGKQLASGGMFLEPPQFPDLGLYCVGMS